jgi:cell volume regulation protein A
MRSIEHISLEEILLAASALLFLSVLASKASARLGVPALLLFLGLGMLAGSDGPGGIYFDDARLAQSIGVVALIYILFSGGLDTEWTTVRPLLWKGLSLSTIGVLITALLVGLFAVVVLKFTLLEGLLLGAIVSPTDAAAVFSVLRGRGIDLKGQVQPMLELESGSNDAMSVFLTVGLTGLLTHPDRSGLGLILGFVLQMGLGSVLGYAAGRAMVLAINRLRLEYEGLYAVLAFSLILLTYGVTASIGGNGFLAVYMAGLVMGKSNFIHKRSVMRFHDGLAWLMQIAMFLTLGLLVFPSRLMPVALAGLAVSLFLMLVGRPVSVFASLAFAQMGRNEKTMISWVGLRGAVPIILATFPLLAGVPKSEIIFDMVFFIVLTSILLQGTSIPLLARLLKLEAPPVQKRQYPLKFEPTERLRSQMVDVEIPPNSQVARKQIVEVGFPKNALIVLIRRKDDFIVPRGDTVLEADDTMLVLADEAGLEQVQKLVTEKQPHPIVSDA